MRSVIGFVLLACILSLGCSCDREYIPSGGQVTERGETDRKADGTSHLIVTIRGCLPDGLCSTGTWEATLDEYNKAEVGSWFGENPPKMVETQASKNDQRHWRQFLGVLATILTAGLTVLVVAAVVPRVRKHKATRLPRATIAKD